MNTFIISSLTNILNTYQSVVAFFYQRILQSKYTNNVLATYVIDYSLLLPASKYIFNLTENQVNAQLQAYINLCTTLIVYITTNVNTQTNLFYENIQNQLNTSISDLNAFSLSLLQAQYQSLITYTAPYDMSMSTVLYNNNIDFQTYKLQILLNPQLADFNNILKSTSITLSLS